MSGFTEISGRSTHYLIDMWATKTRNIRSLLGQCSRCRYNTSITRPSLSAQSLRYVQLRSISTPTSSPYRILDQTYKRDTYSNTPPAILSKIDRQLLHHPSHPLSILRNIIESHFSTHTSLTPSSPIVSVWQNFDELGFPPDHPGRSLTDSYYLNKVYMLRTHTSAHEVETYRKGLDRWLISADVYRRDEIDASHYPVFHQMEGTHVWPSSDISQIRDLNSKLQKELESCPLIIEDNTTISATNPYQPTHDPELAEEVTKHLKHSLNSLIYRLFGSQQMEGEPLRVRWIEAFFPFTSPSYEVEVWWNGEWLELLGCGVVQQKTLDQAGEFNFLPINLHPYAPNINPIMTELTPDQSHKAGWAFGLGLERIAMVLFNIPDIRLFWSSDKRFLNQFKSGEITRFQEYSKYPPCYKDMSFWVPPISTSNDVAGGKGRVFHENDYCEIVREVAGDLVENVTLVSNFSLIFV